METPQTPPAASTSADQIAGDQVAGDKITIGAIEGAGNVVVGGQHTHIHQQRVASHLFQLPAQVREFVGRETEIVRLTAALQAQSGSTATVSGLQGLGGVGKSQLAIVVAQRLRESYPDGQLVIDMRESKPEATLTSAQALEQALRAFDRDAQLPEDEGELQSMYRAALQGKRVLILADDARDAAQVEPLLPPAGSALLLTSRLRFELPGMSERLDLEPLPEEQAIALLQQLSPPIGEHAPAIARLCGYLPLALRVAAGLTKKTTRPIEDFVAQLTDERQRLARLRDQGQNIDVDASLSLNYQALPEPERLAFRRLGVCAGSFDAAAATAIIAAEAGGDALDLIDALYQADLVEFDLERRRYRLHELLRLFALARLEEAGETSATRRRHAEHYLAVLQEAAKGYNEASAEAQRTGLDLLASERTQIEAAMTWAQQSAGQAEGDKLLLEFFCASTEFDTVRFGVNSARLAFLQSTLAAVQRTNRQDHQVDVLTQIGLMHEELGQANEAANVFSEALTLSRALDSKLGQGNLLYKLGDLAWAAEQYDEARSNYDQALALLVAAEDQQGQANVFCSLGDLQLMQKDYVSAQKSYQQALALYRALGDRLGEASVLSGESLLLLSQDWLEEAKQRLEEAVAVLQAIDILYNVAIAYMNFGSMLCDLDKGELAQPYLLHAAELYEKLGHPEQAAEQRAAAAEAASDSASASQQASPAPPGSAGSAGAPLTAAR